MFKFLTKLAPLAFAILVFGVVNPWNTDASDILTDLILDQAAEDAAAATSAAVERARRQWEAEEKKQGIEFEEAKEKVMAERASLRRQQLNNQKIQKTQPLLSMEKQDSIREKLKNLKLD